MAAPKPKNKVIEVNNGTAVAQVPQSTNTKPLVLPPMTKNSQGQLTGPNLIVNKAPNPEVTAPAPKENVRTDLAFNPDGSVTRNGTTFSPGEYKDLLAVQKGEGSSSNPLIQAAAMNPQERMVQQQQLASQELAQQLASSAGIAISGVDSQGNYLDSKGMPINWKEVGLSTVGDPNAWTKIGGAIAAGAVGGSFIPGIGNIAGAILGAAVGVGASVLSNVRAQKADNLNTQKLILTQGQSNLNKLTLLVQADPARAPEYIDSFNQQLDNIAQAYANLKADASSNLNLIVEQDGSTQLARFQSFYSQGGGYDYYTAKMQNAVITPNAQAALAELAVVQQSIGSENE